MGAIVVGPLLYVVLTPFVIRFGVNSAWLFIAITVESLWCFGAILFAWRSRRRFIAHLERHNCALCPNCLYALDPSAPKATCPECGTAHEIASLQHRWTPSQLPMGLYFNR